jgi:hypothetical protein
MKTPVLKYHKPLAAVSFGFIALCLGLLQSVHAVNTTLNYTNVADAWLTSTSWSPANNWNSGAVKTNTTTADVRLSIGTNTTINRAVSATYDATMGTTIFDNTSVATIGLVIGSGNTTTGALTIASGTLVIRNGAQAANFGGLLVGNPSTAGSGQGTLTLSGGNLVFTNGSGSGFSVMSIGFRGGNGGGANFSQGIFTVGGGSVATIERLSLVFWLQTPVRKPPGSST